MSDDHLALDDNIDTVLSTNAARIGIQDAMYIQ
jgi:hypothetical protein